MSLRSFLFVAFCALAAHAGTAAAVSPLVEGRWLEKHLADPRIVIVDMSDDDAQYQRFHLPGAVRRPYEALLAQRPVPAATPPGAGEGAKGPAVSSIPVRLDDAELARLLGSRGITRDKYVVIYDDVGGLNAARLYWELERIGHPKVSVLEGGLVKWILQGRKVVNNAPAPQAVVYEPGTEGRANEASLEEVRAAIIKRDALLLDVRTREEYVGDPRQARTGHVPGARLWPWEQAVDSANGFVRAEEAALKQSLAAVGARDRKAPIIAYCRSGHRAAHTYLVLRSLGFENVRVYANSMNEYALAPELPLKQGPRP